MLNEMKYQINIMTKSENFKPKGGLKGLFSGGKNKIPNRFLQI
jgi:hypothetical protein